MAAPLPEARSCDHDAGAYCLDLPDAPRLAVERSDGPDFAVHYVEHDGATLLGIYDGFAASVPPDLDTRSVRLGAETVQRAEWIEDGARQIFFDRGADALPANQIHLFYAGGLSSEQKALADEVAEGLFFPAR